MKKSIRTIFPAVLAGLLAGCAGQSPEMPAENGAPCADPRDRYRAQADAFIRDYVPREDGRSVEYAPEQKDSREYAAVSSAVRNVYENVDLFRSAKKWESMSAEYRAVDGSCVFRLTAERTGAKLRLESSDPGSGAVLFAAVAEIPEVVQMPGSIPAQMEESVSREMNMIFQFLMNPQLPPKSVSLKTHPMINVSTKKVEDEPQEFLVGDFFCNRLEIALKELYGGGLLYIYVTTDPKHLIRRIDFPDLVLCSGSRGAFSLYFPAYTDREGFSVPAAVVFNGMEYKLADSPSGFSVKLLSEPQAAAPASETSEDKTDSPDSDASSDEGKDKKEDGDGQGKTKEEDDEA